ncbi:FecR family protein [Sphingobacterium paucimobilis]|uniref:FecR protein domain-containing protein n=1 Tax=Sphingobacterium paucimobilis HER1398 TaxID=1346330 RepID=U2J3W1_9SPHI|nr:FecR domain-containing protein [Sphingobacterium paucimobilis]ERJ59614.1 hypothetical protein M472_12610 [Sphingobacterium paucimobilis HER1398]
MDNPRKEELLNKQVEQHISDEERSELDRILQTEWLLADPQPDKNWKHLYQSYIRPRSIRKISTRWVAAAAILLIGGFTYLVLNLHDNQEHLHHSQHSLTHIVGGNEAVTLSVNAKKTGNLSDQSIEDIINTLPKEHNTGSLNQLSVNTHNSNTYNFTLPDGSKIWLNANSEVTFPEHFNSNERRILIKGEVYLDVVKNNTPFVVVAEGTETKVLGTTFNLKTNNLRKQVDATLFTGKIQLTTASQELDLFPGEAARASLTGLSKYTPNLKKVIAWKNNQFYFDNENIAQILSELSEWYQVKFEIQDNSLSQRKYSGAIDRNLPLKEALDILNFGTSYTLHITDTNTIIVTKKK